MVSRGASIYCESGHAWRLTRRRTALCRAGSDVKEPSQYKHDREYFPIVYHFYVRQVITYKWPIKCSLTTIGGGWVRVTAAALATVIGTVAGGD